MKPHLLMLLLLAIPPLVANILACETAEKSDNPPAAEKSYSAPAKVSPAHAATPAAAPAAAAVWGLGSPAGPAPPRTPAEGPPPPAGG